ncbi:MAG TPA: hypothetical protein VLA00_18175 [Xanthobacteraceae bacterium]|nr:hypothetical protein [Xanthobacteraceae bacterium]
MRYGDKAWRAQAVRRAAAGLLVLVLAGCAAAETPVPFIDSPGERPAAASRAPAPARGGRAAVPAARLAYPTFATPKVGDSRPVLDPAAQARMEADLQRLAREREQLEPPQ